MMVNGSYDEQGDAHLQQFLPGELAQAFLHQLKDDLQQVQLPLQSLVQSSTLLNKGAVELYGYRYKPMINFLWGMTPPVANLTGRDLLPTYSFFRIYQYGDICRVHSDRGACEHSLSLTLGYSDGKSWEFQIGSAPISEPQPFADSFDEGCSAIYMQPGDAVLYKGAEYRHGRTTPNPNRWSAHMFLHWVDRNGPHSGCAHDGVQLPSGVPEFSFS
jgi:hypothetical protein